MTSRQFCDGWCRRDFLRVGAASAMGFNLSMARLIQAEAAGETANGVGDTADKTSETDESVVDADFEEVKDDDQPAR